MTLKEKLWYFSLFAGILTIITVFAPAWGVIVPSYSFFVWFWGLEVSTGGDSLSRRCFYYLWGNMYTNAFGRSTTFDSYICFIQTTL